MDIIAESEGTLGVDAMLATHHGLPLGSVVMMSPIVAPGQVTYPGGGGRALVPADELRAMVWFVGGLSPFGSSGAQRLIDSVQRGGSPVRGLGRPAPPAAVAAAGAAGRRGHAARLPAAARRPGRPGAARRPARRPGGHRHGARFPGPPGGAGAKWVRGHRRDRRRGRRGLADAGDHGAQPRVRPKPSNLTDERHALSPASTQLGTTGRSPMLWHSSQRWLKHGHVADHPGRHGRGRAPADLAAGWLRVGRPQQCASAVAAGERPRREVPERRLVRMRAPGRVPAARISAAASWSLPAGSWSAGGPGRPARRRGRQARHAPPEAPRA